MLDVIAEIQEVGALDPAAQRELLENLLQTDPTLWPLVVQQVRASVASRQPFNARAAVGIPAGLPQQTPLPCPVPPRVPGAHQEHEVAFHEFEHAPAGEAMAVGDQAEPDSWQTHLEKAIHALESELERSPQSDEQLAQAKEHLAAALERLAQSCPLVVRNLSFATEIELFGRYQPFEKYEFEPGQKVLLYAELENFQSRETCRGFHTATQSNYQIIDSSGRRVAEHEFAPSEEHCPNRRRDYFIGYEFNLPSQSFPGKHVLQLTVADQNSQKIGQASIEFTVKSTGD